MMRPTRWALGLTITAFLLLLVSDLAQKASMQGKERGESKGPATVSTVGYRSPGERHKVSVTDHKLAQELRSQGARIVADYGSYTLIEVDNQTVTTLSEKSNAAIVDENNLILLNAGTIDTTTREAQSKRATINKAGGKQMRLIQFAGPIRPEWYQALTETGARVVTYIPNNAYLVYGTARDLAAVQQLATNPAIAQWDGDYVSQFRIDPSITASLNLGKGKVASKTRQPNLSAQGNEQFTIQLVEDPEENATTLALIDQLKLEPIITQQSALGYVNVKVALPKDALVDQIAQRGDVVSIQQWITPVKRDERQDIIMAGSLTGNAPTPMNYLTYLAGKGFALGTPSTFAVNVSDSGIDNATTTPNHFALYTLGNSSLAANSRIIYNRLLGTPNAGTTLQGCDGHGNINSHIIGGYVPDSLIGVSPHSDAAGFRYGLGIAPFVRIGSSVIFDPDTFTAPDYEDLESRAYQDGARISSNSWGSTANGYTTDSQRYDALVRDAQPETGCSQPNCVPAVGNQDYVIIFAAGNNGSGGNTVGSPSTGKNVITVGAAENVHAFGGADGCGIGDTGADSANDIIGFSSRGPTADGRKKPDIMAPGTHITGGVAQASNVLPPGSGTGAQLGCFNGNGVCGGVLSNFFPAGQQYYTASSGTSHSTPAVAGVAALIRQHFINQAATPPTPAMTKALIMNSARYMTGVGANDTLPSNNQGLGEVSLNNYFDIFPTAHIFRDQVGADKFTASGQLRVTTGAISDTAKPFRVTLAWTDTPGPTSGSAFVNNLDLEVTVGGNTYKGNVFSGASSATGGTATRNNVESVVVPAGVTGTFVIKVIATNIAGNGVPGDADLLDQDYALVVYNGAEAPLPVITGGNTSVTAESCAPLNSAGDPGEVITFNLPVTNIGTADTTNLVATLQTTGGVTNPSGPQSYGALVANGSAVSRAFTFTVDPAKACGSSLVLTLQLQDGATNIGTVPFTFRVGSLGTQSTAPYGTGNIAVPIPDSSAVEVPINVNASGAATDVNVSIRLNHTFDGDLMIELVAPDNTTVTLAANRGGSGDNFGSGPNDCSGTSTIFDDSAATTIGAGAAPFASTFRPESSLSVLNGLAINGTWKVRFTDTAAQDTGTVGCVTLEITRRPFECCGIQGLPLINSGGNATITAESIAPANGVPDPGETITATFPAVNSGNGNTTNLVATMQTSGGVTPTTTTANYGVVSTDGTPVSRPFTFVANGTCGNNITATLHFQDGAIDLGNVTYTFRLGTINTTSQTFSNATAITIPTTGTGVNTGAPANPYPSNITVAGFTIPVSRVSVTIKSITHEFPSDVDVLLVGPTGQKFIVMSDVIGSIDWSGQTYTFDDAAAATLPSSGAPPASGSFQPTNFGTGDLFPAPAPAAPYLSPGTAGSATFASVFGGLDPNGTWSLYVVDDASGDIGTFAGGWDLTLISSSNVCNSQSCVITPPANITVPKDESTCGTVVNYSGPTITGACGVVTNSAPSGSFFGIGTTTVNFAGAGGATASFNVTVTENQTLATGSGTNVGLNFCNTTVTFANVLTPGDTTVTNASPQTLPAPYVSCVGCPQLDISTTAVPQPGSLITTCIVLRSTIPTDDTFQSFRLLHSEDGILMNRTISSVSSTRTICAGTTTLSPFVVALDPSAPTAAPASISGTIATADGAPLAGATMRLEGASSARTITDSNGNYRFENVESGNFYTVTPALVNHRFNPMNRAFSVNGSRTDAVFTAIPEAIATGNAIDSSEYFVRQQYIDFLGREPDQGGFEYWTDRLDQCQGEAVCIRATRIDVSAAFFYEPEFQDTGAFIFRLYTGTLGRQLGYAEFSVDRQQVVAGPNLEQSKAAFANAFVQRAEFVQRYQNNSSAESFVDALLQAMRDSAGVDLSSERTNLINKYHEGGSQVEGRGLVVRQLADVPAVSQALYNGSFVLMEYFGYLKRDPDQGGYDYWLNVLNNRQQGNYRGLVCAFITSTEYQRRFSPVVTRSNADCGR